MAMTSYIDDHFFPFSAMYLFMFEKDEEKKKVLHETFKNETLPNYLKNMEKILTARGGKHFAGNDVIFFVYFYIYLAESKVITTDSRSCLFSNCKTCQWDL